MDTPKAKKYSRCIFTEDGKYSPCVTMKLYLPAVKDGKVRVKLTGDVLAWFHFCPFCGARIKKKEEDYEHNV